MLSIVTVIVCILALMLIAGMVAMPVSRPVNAAQNGQIVPGQYISKLVDSVETGAAAKELGRLYGLIVQFTYPALLEDAHVIA